MRRRRIWTWVANWLMAGLLPGIGIPVHADTAVLNPVKDNTLIESAGGSSSAGATVVCFIGKVGAFGLNTLRRSALKFDVESAVPPGSTVTSATLTLYFVQSHQGGQTIRVHKFLADWGEGTSAPGFVGGTGADSTPGDVTWVHQFYPSVFWSTPGGVYSTDISATGTGGPTGSFSWSTPGLLADVQSWVASPATNFGWCIRGNEVTAGTAQKLTTREWPTASQRPKLTIVFTPPTASPADLNHDGHVDGLDLANLLAAWGKCTRSCSADLDRDGIVNGTDLGSLLAAWYP